jgi:thiol-disulfide isomerase/thioredoxin
MRKLLLAVFMATAALLAFAQEDSPTTETYQRLTGIPKPPVAGSTIEFVYHPQGGPLADAKEVAALVYMYNSYKWTLGDAVMTKDGDGWRGSFDIPADCAFMAFLFQDTWSQFATVKDNNDNKGFLYIVSDSNGQPLPGGNLAWGIMRKPSAGLGIAGYFNEGYQEIEQDALYFWYQKELQQHQDKAELFFPTMMSIVDRQTGERFPEAAEMFFGIFSKQAKPTESNYIAMENLYRFRLKNADKADSVHQIILSKFPNGWTVRRAAFDQRMREKENFHQKTVELLKKYPQSESQKLDAYQPFIYYNAARSIVTDYYSGDFDQQELIDLLPEMDFKTVAELFRSSAAPFHIKKAVSDDIILPLATPLIEEMRKKVTDRSYCEGVYMSPRQSDFLARNLLDGHLGTYSDILLCKGQPEEAIKFIGFITPDNRYAMPEVNETHVKALLQIGQAAKVTDVMRQAFQKNAVTPGAIELFKAQYEKEHGNADGFDAYMASMKPKEGMEELKAEIAKKFIKEAYQPFSLKDMNGNTVRSADWKGKVVVLDFWASWCYPCKNAFPGMQMAVDHFKDDPNVLFYFIDTMENSDGYEKNARDYMKEKGFTFNVLFDAKKNPRQNGKNQVVFSQMNAINHSMAIPRKMFLKDGFVRLTEEGYGGSPSRLADEVIAAVELLKNE